MYLDVTVIIKIYGRTIQCTVYTYLLVTYLYF